MKPRLVAILAISSIALSACGYPRATSESAAASAPSPTATSISAVALLTKAQTTVLDQPLAYPTEQPAQLSSVVLTIPPGVSTGWHHHDAPMYAYVQSGEVTVEYKDGPTKVYPAGSAIVEAIGTDHNGTNRGSVDAVLIVVNIGAEGVANSVKVP